MASTRLSRFLSKVLQEYPFTLLGVFFIVFYLGLCSSISKFLLVFTTLRLIHDYISTQPDIENPEKWSVIIGGAGVSGIAMLKSLKSLGFKDITVLEKAGNLGGTWYENTYPGVACDIPSHLYSFSFFLSPSWSKAYSSGKEIWRYLDGIVNNFGLRKHIKFNVKIDTVQWNDDTKMWEVSTQSGEVYKANIFVSGTGALHIPSKPKFKNEESFTKPIVHTAEWDNSMELEGKRVGIIGTGATSVQAVPSLAEKVKSVTCFQRTPAWIPPRFQYDFPEYVKKMFAMMPLVQKIFRWFLYWNQEVRFFMIFQLDSPFRKGVTKLLTNEMQKQLGNDPHLSENLVPKYELGCKRITPSDVYLKSFLRENVHLVTEPIEEFTEKGIKTKSGEEHEFDIIVKATGFDVMANVKAYKGIGKDGAILYKQNQGSPFAHLGVTIPGFPNFFVLLGPNTGLGHNSVLFMIECQVNYVLDCIRKLSKAKYGHAKAIEIKQSAFEDFVDWMKIELRKTVFVSGCASWYHTSLEIPWVLWPKSTTEYWWKTLTCQEKQYNFEY